MPVGEWYRGIPDYTSLTEVSDVTTYDAAYAAASGSHPRILVRGNTYNMIRVVGKAGLQVMAYPGERVKVVGNLPLQANDMWIWGLETTDPLNTGSEAMMQISAKNISIINCWNHDTGDDESACISDFGTDLPGGGSLVYGNVLHDGRHVNYCQNKSTIPAKYYAHNYIGRAMYDATDLQGQFIIHNFSGDRTKVRNVHFLENIMAQGAILVGANEAGTSWGARFENNLMYKVCWRGTYNNPGEIFFKNNRVYELFDGYGLDTGSTRMLDLDDLHGAGETFDGPPFYPQNHIFTGNLIYMVSSAGANSMIVVELKYRTSAAPLVPPSTLHFSDGLQRAASFGDVFNTNQYFGAFRNQIRFSGTNQNCTTLAAWQTQTAAANNPWDAASTFTAGAPPNYSVIRQNEYDSDRALIAVIGYAGAFNVTLPRVGDIYEIHDQWTAPVHTGSATYSITPPFFGIVKYVLNATGQVLRPIADSFAGLYTTGGGASFGLYNQIDEVVIDNADYIRSPISPVNAVYVGKLTAADNPVVNTDHVMKLTYNKNAAAGNEIDVTVEIRQSWVSEPSNIGTLIATRSFTATDTFTNFQDTLTEGEAAVATDYTALYVRIISNEVPL